MTTPARRLLTGILGLFCLWLIAREFLRPGSAAVKDSTVVVSFAHAQLEPGVREAFDALARDYMALHPKVRLEQIAVPRRTWAQWIQTRLIGDDPPDLVQLVDNDPNLILRHFHPLDRWMAEPNPYNAGTTLASVAWRDTFIAPLSEPPTYWPRFLRYYGAPLTIFTFRMYYNRELLREINGEDRPPATYAEFVALCGRIQRWATEHQRPIYPLAGARPVPPNEMLFTDLLRSQTQIMLRDVIDRTHSLGGGGGAGGDPRDMAREAWFDRAWTLHSPAVQSGFRLVREVGSFFQPGFLGADRDQAMFYFLQRRSVMIYSGNWDYQGIVSQAPFSIGLFSFPFPGPEDPRYGSHTLGRMSEAEKSMRGAFALSKRARHPAEAIDFLRYLTSITGHAKFARLSNWLPAVRGVDFSDQVRTFAPYLGGYPPGFYFNGGVETTRLWVSNINQLFSAENGVEKFTQILEPEMDRAILLDDAKEARDLVNVIFHYDLRAAAEDAERLSAVPDLSRTAQRSALYEAQTQIEMTALRSRCLQARLTPP